jgi:hypothetical protein
MVSETDANFRDVTGRIAGLQKSLGSADEDAAPEDREQDTAAGKNRISFL